MKKKTITLVIIYFLLTTVCGQTIDFRAEVFNGVDNENTVITISHTRYENPNTILTLELDDYGAYYLSSKAESGDTIFGKLTIGYNITEVNKTIERIQYFIEHDDLEYILIHTGENIFLKLFKEYVVESENNKFENYTLITTYITDGTDICLTLYEKFVKEN